MAIITTWFDFKVVYKPKRVHFVHDHLSTINYGESTLGVEYHLLYVTLSLVGIDWCSQIFEYIYKRVILKMISQKKNTSKF
jgi:hypothetical protein